MKEATKNCLINNFLVFNAGDDLVVVPISSTPATNDPHVFAIRDTDSFFGQSGLKCSSCVKWTKPLAVSKTVIHRRIGGISPDQLAVIHDRIRSMFPT